ncbi:hypothetical protein [Mycobacterium asiaticum]|uniref:Uncharacterized protein n=1 Tax=Mycobacterium asiaticum TaxID=1790 RepID=A0A1A3NAH1_MYCAS|nr:hypothetical protein [Mycobacterium asiaticum]OBK17362.1 hypothetical protein A5636_22750 [Mycobacterium asiaticum]
MTPFRDCCDLTVNTQTVFRNTTVECLLQHIGDEAMARRRASGAGTGTAALRRAGRAGLSTGPHAGAR